MIKRFIDWLFGKEMLVISVTKGKAVRPLVKTSSGLVIESNDADSVKFLTKIRV